MVSLPEHAIAERLLYRLIKKNIAGTTMSSAIEKAKELNDKRIAASISFLSNSAADSTKARYATTTYLELIRRIARLGLKASVQVPLSQVGSSISGSIVAKNVKDIVGTANNYGVFVWLETNGGSRYAPSFLKNAKGIGYAVSIRESEKYLNGKGYRTNALKILCSERSDEDEGKHADIFEKLKKVADNMGNTVLQSVPESTLRKLLNGSKLKKSLVFEFQLGYSNKKINEVVKKGARTSVYVPFGKDWERYAVNRAPGRYAHFLATKILKEG